MAVEHAYGKQISQSPKPHPLLPNRLSSVFFTSLSVPTTNPHGLRHPTCVTHSKTLTTQHSSHTLCGGLRRPRFALLIKEYPVQVSKGRSQRGKPLSCQPQSSVTTEFCAPEETPTASPYIGTTCLIVLHTLLWLGILYPPNSYPDSILTLFFLISFPEALPRNPLKITSKIAIAFKPELAWIFALSLEPAFPCRYCFPWSLSSHRCFFYHFSRSMGISCISLPLSAPSPSSSLKCLSWISLVIWLNHRDPLSFSDTRIHCYQPPSQHCFCCTTVSFHVLQNIF